MEDLRFECNDPFESFFCMSNPTLADIDNNNGHTSMSLQNHHLFNFTSPHISNLSINNNNGLHHSHHGVVLKQGQGQNNVINGHFSTPLSQHNHHGIHQKQSGNIDPFDYNFTAMSKQNNHGTDSNDPFNGLLSQINQHDGSVIQRGQNGNNETVSHPMVQDQHDHDHDHNQNVIPVLPNQIEAMSLDEWPPTPVPYLCSCCQVLREIIHANGIQFEKLEIHGRLGLITHAIHHQTPVNGNPPTYQIIDFCRRSLDEIKKFLAQYCVEHTLAGYFILQDPMSAYYETLCTGLDWIEDFNMDGLLVDNNQNSSDEMVEQEGENVASNGTPDKKNLSEQRKKAGKLKLSDLCDSFHLPIEEAAARVDLCPTVVKKTCRKAGLARWPHRKVKSLLKQIALLGTQLDRQDPATRATTEEEIHRLKTEMIQHCGGQIPTAMYNIEAFLPLYQ